MVDRGLPDYSVKTLWEHEADQHRIVMLFPAEKYGLSRDKLVARNFGHDLVPETLERDHTPKDGLSETDKYILELASCNKLMKYLGLGAIVPKQVAKLKEGWLSYHFGTEPEDRVLKQIDKISAYKEAMEEKAKGRLDNIDDFYSSALSKVEDKFLLWVLQGLRKVENTSTDPQATMERLISSHDQYEHEQQQQQAHMNFKKMVEPLAIHMQLRRPIPVSPQASV